MAYELTIGKRPYNGRDRKAIRDEMLAREVKIPSTCKSISKEGVDFINKVKLKVFRWFRDKQKKDWGIMA